MIPVHVTRDELSTAYHDAPPRIVPGEASRHTGVEAVARLVAERCGVELTIDGIDHSTTVRPA